MNSKKSNYYTKNPITRLVFALGGPGTNCSAHCRKLADDFGFKRVDLNDILSAESEPVFVRFYTRSQMFLTLMRLRMLIR